MVDTYASETNKTAAVWRELTDDQLEFRPHPRSSTVREILAHQLLSERRWVFWRPVLHTAHHRAQIGVYLRMLENRVPPTYGPTADATWAGADPTTTLDAASRRGA